MHPSRYQVRMLVPAQNPPYEWPSRRNMRPAACDRCGHSVAAEAGLLVRDLGAGGRWAVLHFSCAPPEIQTQATAQFAEEDSPPVFTFDVRNGEVLIRQPQRRLSRDQFDTMLKLQRSCCRRVKEGRHYLSLAPLDRAGEIQQAYEAAGFNVAITDDLQSAMEADELNRNASLLAAQERAANVDAILHEVGLKTTGEPFSLYDFQRTGIRWLAGKRRALLADDQGLGKTIQSSVAFADGAPVVIVAPVSLLENWAREVGRWRPERAQGIKILGSGKGEKKTGSFKRWPLPGETFITTYSRLPKDVKKIGAPAPGTYLICDEAHNLKTLRIKGGKPQRGAGTSNRAAEFWYMSNAVLTNNGTVWIMTGTPLMNRANELWSLLQQADLATESFGNIYQFADDFGVPRSGYGGAWDWTRAKPDPAIVGEKLQRVMLRREKQDVLKDLPPKVYQTIEVSIDPDAEAKLSAIEDAVMLALMREESRADDVSWDVAQIKRQEKALRRAREGAKLTSEEKDLLRETKGDAPKFEEIARARRIIATAKTPALLNLIRTYEAMGEPLIVFSAHLEPLKALEGLDGWKTITGKTKPAERQRIVDAFQRGELKGVGGQIRAAGVGLTLTRSANVIFLDKDWTPAGNVQAEDRAHRIGQQRPVNIISLVADHAIDKRVNALLDHKTRLIKHSISAGKRGAREEVVAPYRMTEQRPAVAASPFDPSAAGFTPGPADPERALAEVAVSGERERIEEERARIEFLRTPTPAQLSAPGRRPPETPDEFWAAEALHALAAWDDDHARERNSMGFSKAHSTEGHQLSRLIRMGMGLTDREWQAAMSTARYHRAQLPPRPSSTDPELAELERVRRRGQSRRRRLRESVSDSGIGLGAWVFFPDGNQAVVYGRGRTPRGQPQVWRIQFRSGQRAEMTEAQMLSHGAAIRPEEPPAPGWSGGGEQQTLWNGGPRW